MANSRATKNLLNKTFGRWTVIGRAEPTAFGAVCWNVQCVCGRLSMVTANNLRTGTTTQCKSCSQRDIAERRRAVVAVKPAAKPKHRKSTETDIPIAVGQRFNTLDVVGRAERRDMWRVRCMFCRSEASENAAVLSEGSAVCGPCRRPAPRLDRGCSSVLS